MSIRTLTILVDPVPRNVDVLGRDRGVGVHTIGPVRVIGVTPISIHVAQIGAGAVLIDTVIWHLGRRDARSALLPAPKRRSAATPCRGGALVVRLAPRSVAPRSHPRSRSGRRRRNAPHRRSCPRPAGRNDASDPRRDILLATAPRCGNGGRRRQRRRLPAGRLPEGRRSPGPSTARSRRGGARHHGGHGDVAGRLRRLLERVDDRAGGEEGEELRRPHGPARSSTPSTGTARRSPRRRPLDS